MKHVITCFIKVWISNRCWWKGITYEIPTSLQEWVCWLWLLYSVGIAHAGTWLNHGRLCINSIYIMCMKNKTPLMAILTGEPGWPDAPGGPGGPGGPWNVNLKNKYKVNASETLFIGASKRGFCLGKILIPLKMWTIYFII